MHPTTPLVVFWPYLEAFLLPVAQWIPPLSTSWDLGSPFNSNQALEMLGSPFNSKIGFSHIFAFWPPHSPRFFPEFLASQRRVPRLDSRGMVQRHRWLRANGSSERVRVRHVDLGPVQAFGASAGVRRHVGSTYYIYILVL